MKKKKVEGVNTIIPEYDKYKAIFSHIYIYSLLLKKNKINQIFLNIFK